MLSYAYRPCSWRKGLDRHLGGITGQCLSALQCADFFPTHLPTRVPKHAFIRVFLDTVHIITKNRRNLNYALVWIESYKMPSTALMWKRLFVHCQAKQMKVQNIVFRIPSSSPTHTSVFFFFFLGEVVYSYICVHICEIVLEAHMGNLDRSYLYGARQGW